MITYRIKIIFFAVLGVFSVMLRGGARSVPKETSRVVVVQNAKLGDMVCTTPIFRAVKEKYPGCEVWVLGNAINKELLEGNKDVDGYIINDQDINKLSQQIRDKNFDFGCVTGPSFDALAALMLAGVRTIAAPRIKNGYSPYETRFYKILSKFVITKPHRMGSYAPREYLRLLEPIGIFTNNTKKHLVFSNEAARRAEKTLKPFAGKFIIGIAPAVGNKIKEWPVERFAEVVNYVGEKYKVAIVIIGGQEDVTQAEKIKNLIKKGVDFIDTTNTLSINELKALISKLSMFIGVDTGPIYIAEAFGVPTVDIVGPMDENEQPPTGPTHRVVLPPGRTKPQLHIMNARIYDHKEARRQVEGTTAKIVIAETDALLRELKIA